MLIKCLVCENGYVHRSHIHFIHNPLGSISLELGISAYFQCLLSSF